MRFTASISIPAAAIALLALGASVGPAEAKNSGPPPARGKDTTAPTITCPSGITIAAMAPMGAVVTFAATATDDKDPSPVITFSRPSGSTFPVGKTTVTVRATDWKNNVATKSFDVTVQPMTGPVSYKAYWIGGTGYGYFEWDISIAADGTISGTGVQTVILDVYNQFNEATEPMPAGLSGTGVVTGTMSASGSCVISSSHNSWYWYLDDYDINGYPFYTEITGGFSGQVTATFNGSGNLVFSVDPLDPPYYDYGGWIRQ